VSYLLHFPLHWLDENNMRTNCACRRHLLRFWLRDPENAWHTPEVLRPRWAQIYEGITPENEVFPIEPFVRSAGNKGR
jgi:hypothetical protein